MPSRTVIECQMAASASLSPRDSPLSCRTAELSLCLTLIGKDIPRPQLGSARNKFTAIIERISKINIDLVSLHRGLRRTLCLLAASISCRDIVPGQLLTSPSVTAIPQKNTSADADSAQRHQRRINGRSFAIGGRANSPADRRRVTQSR